MGNKITGTINAAYQAREIEGMISPVVITPTARLHP
jgi:hypothetical protein